MGPPRCAAGPADTEDRLTDDHANKDATAGEIAGPVFLPLRPRPVEDAAAETAAGDAAAVKTTGRRRPSGDKLSFAPSR